MLTPKRPLLTQLYGWWYVCLALAFAALAWRTFLYGGPGWGIWLRCMVSGGFGYLARITFRSGKVR